MTDHRKDRNKDRIITARTARQADRVDLSKAVAISMALAVVGFLAALVVIDFDGSDPIATEPAAATANAPSQTSG
ncbi:MAG: hypothetical protein KDJ77_11620 [Rhodobiaceae bacterium]|nr:hypothetical protein [Rhodobiaceae bacterium]